MKVNYYKYIRSPEWKQRKSDYKEYRGVEKCYLCKSFCKCDLHHKNYHRLGEEKNRDLRFLCRSCHEFVHSIVKIKNGEIRPVEKSLARRWSAHCSSNGLWSLRRQNPDKFKAFAIEFFKQCRARQKGTMSFSSS